MESSKTEREEPEREAPRDLEVCPRCFEPVGKILWGQTNCPRCGLHFECC